MQAPVLRVQVALVGVMVQKMRMLQQMEPQTSAAVAAAQAEGLPTKRQVILATAVQELLLLDTQQHKEKKE
jgi:hypothetical protein